MENMNIIGITRVFNEDDIIESFVRHHSIFFNSHIFIDNGSSDQTVDILIKLKNKGFNIILFENKSIIFQEMQINTEFYKFANNMNPDWIMYIDADEFIDIRNSKNLFYETLKIQKEDIESVLFELNNYQNTFEDDHDEIAVPVRITHRLPCGSNVWKTAVRGQIRSNVVIEAGNHGVIIDDRYARDCKSHQVKLAHFNRRSVWQELTKIIIGHLKAISTGKEAKERNWSAHYKPFYEKIKNKPWEILKSDYLLSKDNKNGQYFYDPMNYLGGDLRYTNKTDYDMKSIISIINYFENLSQSHGDIVDLLRENNIESMHSVIRRIF
ncbi:Glycosyltransferase [Granulibacter bethesdensis]|nr:Glycosyltransferase [Granulibacter bethesdensis]